MLLLLLSLMLMVVMLVWVLLYVTLCRTPVLPSDTEFDGEVPRPSFSHTPIETVITYFGYNGKIQWVP